MRKQIKKDDLQKIKAMDLLTYFQNYEPDELTKISRNVFGTKTHSSLQISNGLWHWFSGGVGGKSALDYLIKVEGMEFLEASHMLLGLINEKTPIIKQISQYKKPKYSFKLPTPNKSNERLFKYLCGERKIDKEIVQECILHFDMYESVINHDVVFVGYDQGEAKYATIRSTSSDQKREIAGSDKRFNFMLKPNLPNTIVNVFEGAIDLLSYRTLLKMQGRDWRKEYMLSLGGVAKIGKDIKNTSIPIALKEFLNKNNISEINLFLDNDETGKEATKVIEYHLGDTYKVNDLSLKRSKDMNHYLCEKLESKNLAR